MMSTMSCCAALNPRLIAAARPRGRSCATTRAQSDGKRTGWAERSSTPTTVASWCSRASTHPTTLLSRSRVGITIVRSIPPIYRRREWLSLAPSGEPSLPSEESKRREKVCRFHWTCDHQSLGDCTPHAAGRDGGIGMGVFCGFWPGPLPSEDGNDRYLPPPLIEARNSALLLFLPILSSRSSIASTVDKGFRTFLSIQIRFNSSLGTSSSSLRVPDLLISMAGKTRLSTSLRSRPISMLPVPLNSSKITSSMRLPVSINAVAMMVILPPSSIFLAAPKNRFGRWSALESTPPDSTFPDGGTIVL